MALMNLAVHFYRPDFTEGQARLLIRDMLDDVEGCTPQHLDAAAKQWRRNPANKFFPTSGQFRKLAYEAREEERRNTEYEARGGRKFEFGDSRPFGWEYHQKRFWKPHWKVSDLNTACDPDRRARYDAWLARKESSDAS